MPTIISLLRGINVGGHKKIKMADLRALYGRMGLQRTRTLLQSGNAIFVSKASDVAVIQQEIEAAIRSEFGFEVPVVLRTVYDFKAVLDRHPFSADQLSEPAKLAIVFLSDNPAGLALRELIESNPGPETVQASGRELFIYYPDGMARSKPTNQFIERRLGIAATARNWNTSQKILALLRGS